MSQMLAIDWDQNEVRYLLATATGPRLKIRSMGTAPISSSSDDKPTDVGRAIQSALAKQRLGRSTVLVALRRADIEVLSITLPPAKDTELPELVANEVLRQSPQLAENATVDFVALNDNANEPRIVSAAVCPAEQIARIRRDCDSAGLTANRVLVRPFALRSLLEDPRTSDRSSLLVCRVGDDIDLAVVAQKRVLYARTVKLPKQADDASAIERLLEEIHRTVVVAPQSRVTGGSIERVCVVGDSNQLAAIVEQLAARLSMPVEIVDPFAAVGVTDRATDATLDRFAPLLGIVHDEVGKRHAIDFLDPRKPPAPPDRRRQLTIAGAIAAVIVAFGGYYVWDELHGLEAHNDTLEAEFRDLKELVKKATGHRRVAESIQQWEARNVNWLDELQGFCERFPSSRDALVLHMSLTPSRSGGGEIDLNGLVRGPEIVLRMENAIRDDFHTVQRKRVQERVQEKAYTWHFDSSVTVSPRSKKEYLADFLKDEAAPGGQRVATDDEETLPVATTTTPSKVNGASLSKEGAQDE
ncbi:MAG: type IV pilus biogenesis protein PilM [Pirellulaceae bacterium]